MGAGGSKYELTPQLIESLLREYHTFGGTSEQTHAAGCQFYLLLRSNLLKKNFYQQGLTMN